MEPNDFSSPANSMIGRKRNRPQVEASAETDYTLSSLPRTVMRGVNLRPVFQDIQRNLNQSLHEAVLDLRNRGLDPLIAEGLVHDALQDIAEEHGNIGFFQPQVVDINQNPQFFIIQMDAGALLVTDANSRPRAFKTTKQIEFSRRTSVPVADLISYCEETIALPLRNVLKASGARPKRVTIYFVAPNDIIYDKLTPTEATTYIRAWTQGTDAIPVYEGVHKRTPYVKSEGEGVTFSFYGNSLLDNFWAATSNPSGKEVNEVNIGLVDQHVFTAMVEIHMQLEYPRSRSTKAYKSRNALKVITVNKKPYKKSYKKKSYRKRKYYKKK